MYLKIVSLPTALVGLASISLLLSSCDNNRPNSYKIFQKQLNKKHDPYDLEVVSLLVKRTLEEDVEGSNLEFNAHFCHGFVKKSP